MSNEIHSNYGQTFLLPPSIDDWVPKGHPARFIRAFVDSLDLGGLGFKVRTSDEGRPNYASELLLKVVLYGYYEEVRSSRRLELACLNNVGFIWLTGMKYPDHNTIWRFISENECGIKRVFRESARLALQMGLVGLVLQALDGTKIAADVSNEVFLNRGHFERALARLDSASDEIFAEYKRNEIAESGLEYRLPEELCDGDALRDSIRENLSLLDKAQTDNLSLTDTDARKMLGRNDSVAFSYNAQAVVDDKARVIVAADVVNDENDRRQLVRMIDETVDNLGEAAQETVADAGYYSSEQLAKAEEAGYNVLVDLPDDSSVKFGYIDEAFDKSKFVYDEETDTYTCPEGHRLTFETYLKHKNGYKGKSYRCTNYKNCPSRFKCSKSSRGRKLSRPLHEPAIAHQRGKQLIEENRQKLKRRKTIVEPVFGIIKQIMKFRRWTVRGLSNVRTQWSIICTVYNLKKLQAAWAK